MQTIASRLETPLGLRIERTWQDIPCATDEVVDLSLALDSQRGLSLSVDAPFHDDPAPHGPAASTPRLWEHEVVELMLLGDDMRYVEIELSPHGHYLALELHGRRNVVREDMPLPFTAAISGARWRGRASIPLSWLPPRCDRLNAFAIHGVGAARRYLAWRPAGGRQPDFHRLDVFACIDELS